MGTLISGTCWPARYPTKWMTMFALALFAGALLGVVVRSGMYIPDVQGGIRVYVKYAGESAYQLANADVYFARDLKDMRVNQVIHVHSDAPAERSQKAGLPIAFMVQLLDAAGKKQGEPVPLEATWATQYKAEVSLRIERDTPRPKR